MAKLGLPLLLPAVGLQAVLSLTPETKSIELDTK